MGVTVGVTVTVPVGVTVGVVVTVPVGVTVAVVVAVTVGVVVTVLVGVTPGVGVTLLEPGTSAVNEVIFAVIPVATCTRTPTCPDVRDVSLALAIQPLGSVVPAFQTLAVSVVPTTRKWIVYAVFTAAVKATDLSVVAVPLNLD